MLQVDQQVQVWPMYAGRFVCVCVCIFSGILSATSFSNIWEAAYIMVQLIYEFYFQCNMMYKPHLLV